jgi:cell volume regulation protein A
MADVLTTASIFLVTGLLLALSVLFSRASARIGVPVFLLFLVLGMLAGSEGIGGIAFEDYRISFRLGTLALVLILFDGGLNTSMASFRRGVGPAIVLGTAGVAITAMVVGGAAHLLGFPWIPALLLGSIVSSTDAAAVFSVLGASGLKLQERAGTTLELESGLNDPMAVILTLALTQSVADGRPPDLRLLLHIPLELLIGGALGLGFGGAGRLLLRRLRLPADGLYPVFTLGLGFLAFGLPTLLSGSGFLAVYLAGLVLGNGDFPYRTGVLRFHDAAAWCGQVTMFLMLGLLVFPSRILAAAGTGLALGAVLTLVARPLAVLLCLLPFRFPARETAFLSWVGLRGAVPIILATFPVLAGVDGAHRSFDIVFCVVVLNALVPGGTVAWAAHRLGLVS